MVNKSFDQDSHSSSKQKAETPMENVFLAFQRVATCNIDVPLKQKVLNDSLKVLQEGLD